MARKEAELQAVLGGLFDYVLAYYPKIGKEFHELVTGKSGAQ